MCELDKRTRRVNGSGTTHEGKESEERAPFYVCLSVYPSVYLSVRPSVRLSV